MRIDERDVMYMTEKIHIAFVADDRYIQHTGVTLTSVLENTKDSGRIVAHLICSGLSEQNVRKLEKIEQKYGCQIMFYTAELIPYNDIISISNFPHAFLFKVSIPDLLPVELDKIIYLDSDMIVLGDVARLWDFDLLDKMLAAVEDPYCFFRKDALNIPHDKKYFNSGLMVMDLSLFRKQEVSKDVFRFIRDHVHTIKFADQDGFNAVLYNQWIDLPLNWNVMDYFFYKWRLKKIMPKERIEIFKFAAKKPNLIHFTGPIKPWHYTSSHPQKLEYHRYLSKTEWYDYRMDGASLRNILEKYVYRNDRLRDLLKKMLPESIVIWLKNRFETV